ncbi:MULTISPECIES: helix-turn-helix domain-containing protein [Bradyrhizobium]|uniref:helix-turn-helix domain-containing protein n=1 Tax=Bradyrhizobium yuanmingense TaxID=108015 RepID=UPI0004BC3E59|nr:helix-turn-helix domain-containing protein [Bradyrhizobium yuanmingense]
MNVSAILWARAVINLSILERAILLHLALVADDELQVKRSQREIAAKVGCSRAAANRTLSRLEARGLISIRQQFGHDGAQRPCVYVLRKPKNAFNVPSVAA